jgi:hypothetical protein
MGPSSGRGPFACPPAYDARGRPSPAEPLQPFRSPEVTCRGVARHPLVELHVETDVLVRPRPQLGRRSRHARVSPLSPNLQRYSPLLLSPTSAKTQRRTTTGRPSRRRREDPTVRARHGKVGRVRARRERCIWLSEPRSGFKRLTSSGSSRGHSSRAPRAVRYPLPGWAFVRSERRRRPGMQMGQAGFTQHGEVR